MHKIVFATLSLVVILLTYLARRYLQPYSIGELGAFTPLLEKLILTIKSPDVEKLPIILGILFAVISLVLSVYLINQVRTNYSNNTFLNILNSIWIICITVNIIVSGYYLIFLILGLLLLGVFFLACCRFLIEMFSESSKPPGGGSNKPVYVRSHYRNRPTRK